MFDLTYVSPFILTSFFPVPLYCFEQDAWFAGTSGNYMGAGVVAAIILAGNPLLTQEVQLPNFVAPVVVGSGAAYTYLIDCEYYLFGGNTNSTTTAHNLQSTVTLTNTATLLSFSSTTVTAQFNTETFLVGFLNPYSLPVVGVPYITPLTLHRRFTAFVPPGTYEVTISLTTDSTSNFSSVLLPISCTIVPQGGVAYSFTSPTSTQPVLVPGV